ncbi:hypothetical protein U1Q18_051242 [Sarracenia purpurea var. burkii]
MHKQHFILGVGRKTDFSEGKENRFSAKGKVWCESEKEKYGDIGSHKQHFILGVGRKPVFSEGKGLVGTRERKVGRNRKSQATFYPGSRQKTGFQRRERFGGNLRKKVGRNRKSQATFYPGSGQKTGFSEGKGLVVT